MVCTALTSALDSLGKEKYDAGMQKLSDTVSALGFVFRQTLTEKRRTLLKTKLPDDFKSLASDRCAPTPAGLLGDLSEHSKRVSETDKITRVPGPRPNTGRDRPTADRLPLVPPVHCPPTRGVCAFNGDETSIISLSCHLGCLQLHGCSPGP